MQRTATNRLIRVAENLHLIDQPDHGLSILRFGQQDRKNQRVLRLENSQQMRGVFVADVSVGDDDGDVVLLKNLDGLSDVSGTMNAVDVVEHASDRIDHVSVVINDQ